jgi:hypothetical protein
MSRAFALHSLVDRLGGDLAAGRHTLPGAVAELEPAARAGKQSLLKGLQVRFGDLPDRQALAACLMVRSVISLRDDPQGVRQLGQRLDGEFRSLFGARVPQELQAVLASQ